MGQGLNNLGNRVGNTALVLPRLGYTGLNAGTDAIDTLAAIPRDFLDVVQYTSHEIKNILSSAWTTGKRYQRVGNIIKSPFVAAGAAIEGAIKTAVTPVVNGIANSVNTVKNTVKNTWRSTFGRVFSKKPISDFSYDKLKTANVIQKNKNGFINRWFSRKSMEGYKGIINEKGNIEDNKGKGDAAAAAVVPIVVPTKTTRTKKDVEVADSGGTIRDKMDKALESTKSSLKETFALKDDNGEITSKTETKAGKPSKVEEVKKEKIEKGETTKGITKDNPETKSEKDVESTEKKDSSKTATESLDTEAKRKGLDEAKNLVEDSICGQKILEGLQNDKDFGIVFDDTTSSGKHDKENNAIVVGTKLPKETNGLAPLNWETKDPEYQKKHILLHELAHCTVHSHKDEIPEIKKGLDIIEKYIDKDSDGKTLSLLSYKNNHYKTNKDKAKEDFVEMLALAMNGKGTNCQKYMELLSDDEHKEFREKNGLATITKDDAEALENACKAVVKFYEGKKD